MRESISYLLREIGPAYNRIFRGKNPSLGADNIISRSANYKSSWTWRGPIPTPLQLNVSRFDGTTDLRIDLESRRGPIDAGCTIPVHVGERE